ncbi:NAD(P)(+) transhydrogenase (Re/Si-specific) subunit beta [Mesonia sp. K7]|uniref:NAD(P)(+) transhydrogenase (Re/Si-specific) subunit beta n=1 Tax=Mesonia sp. K7 TaxID=2218606 RepID=UPI000DA810D2|nr:NAD(P)(+) transhydrogenase (Re/Si-specific) subunit beta [Mesonia sp. K7]PZD76699.1 NAD(P)(+) transhydrogenase (Re/Si-specific) subunit beta [Mesonia sp. K7]
MQVITDVGYLLASFSFIIGLKLMSSPQKAKKGNRVATIGMGIALITVLIGGISKNINYTSLLILSIAILAGVIVGRKMAFTVKMTAMPQMVSLLNATGGGCAMLLGYIEASQISEYLYSSSLLLLNLGVVTGAIALSGSIVAYLKLGGKIRDLHQGGVHWFSRVLFLCIVLLPLGYFLQIIPWSFYELTLVLIFIGLLYGVLFVVPIGGADMPVVISLLNSITGIATALAGLLYANKAMIAGGIFVGAAGIFLTMLMCKAMNRSLWRVIVGNTGSKTQNIGGETSQEIRETSVSEVVTQLLLSKKIGIVPGYGMAVAQAQHTCAQLQNLLQNKGKTLDYIIHPVAGRMPGHMNVLLAEAKIGYHYLKEMHEVNDEMGSYDMIFVIGANDVVNPAAESNPASPIYGMPIIKSHLSKQVVVFKRSMKPGYSGVSNDLFEYDNCQLLFGDAQVSLQEIVTQLKALN